MSQTNCINCGAAIEIEVSKCPFCGTTYFDLTAIDMTSKQPIALKIKLRGTKHDGTEQSYIITQLVRPQLATLEQTMDSHEARDAFGDVVFRFQTEVRCVTNLTFNAVGNQDGVLYTIQEVEA